MAKKGGLGLDHVVHINNGSDAARPIVLHLLPGEETIFELKVVNHGEPSDISLEASDPVFKAVRFRKPDNHVVKEEIIPIMARMPANKKRLDGEILLTSNGGESRVPISLLRDSEDAGIGQSGLDLQEDKNLSDNPIRDVSGQGYAERDSKEKQRADAGDYDLGDDDSDAYNDADDKPFQRSKSYGDAEDDEDAGDEDDSDAVPRVHDLDSEEEKEPRRIVFSRDRDLERYRSAGRRKAEDNLDEVGGSVRGQRRAKRIIDRGISRDTEGRIDERFDPSTVEDSEDNTGNLPVRQQDNRAERRFNSRIDDSYVDRNSGRGEAIGPSPSPDPWEGRPLESADAEGQRMPDDLPDDYQGFRPESDTEGNGGRDGIEEREGRGGRGVRDVREILSPLESEQGAAVESEGYLDQDGHDLEQDNSGLFGLVQMIPIIIFLALLTVLVLTFITYTIPEFPGAVASSILIVTLIIYGAATLLKA
jgi:hypothetical protein